MASDDLTVAPDYVFEETIKYSTAVSKFENGTEQRRSLWSTPLRKFKLAFRNRNSTDYGTLRDLFNAKLGAYTSFLWTNPNDSTQYTVRFDDDSLMVRQKAYGIYDVEFSLVQVK
jgi:phage-related protein